MTANKTKERKRMLELEKVLEQEKSEQEKLRKALEEANLRNEIISSISKNYCSIYRVDIARDFFEEISNDDEIHKLTGYQGCASEKFYSVCDTKVAPEYRQALRPFLNVATLPERLRSEEYVTAEYRMCDGTWHRLRFIVKKRDEAGEVTHVLCTVRSISDVKRRELDLRFAAEAAKRESEMTSRFLATMSHDIRTPLNGLIGMVHLARQYADEPEMCKKLLDKSVESLEYLVSLVNDILDMNKIQSGQLTDHEMNFDLAKLLQKTNQKYASLAAEKEIDYKVVWEKDMLLHPHLVGNPVYLERILSNIADNAVKFSNPCSEITVWLKEEKEEDDRILLTFYCRDEGIGMTEEFVAHAFDVFTQENSDTGRSKYEGSGLGLAIAQKLAERMGGNIRLDSKPGVGTTAIITLPFKIGKQTDEIGYKENRGKVSIQGLRALLVEDNDINMEIAKTLLEQNGLEVTCASDGQEAVEIFEHSAPGYFGVVYMDIMMPRMDGLDATRTIRAMKRRDAREVAIIAMSANAFSEDVIGCRLAGMNMHLAKPLDEKKMIDALQQCIATNEEIFLRDDL